MHKKASNDNCTIETNLLDTLVQNRQLGGKKSPERTDFISKHGADKGI